MLPSAVYEELLNLLELEPDSSPQNAGGLFDEPIIPTSQEIATQNIPEFSETQNVPQFSQPQVAFSNPTTNFPGVLNYQNPPLDNYSLTSVVDMATKNCTNNTSPNDLGYNEGNSLEAIFGGAGEQLVGNACLKRKTPMEPLESSSPPSSPETELYPFDGFSRNVRGTFNGREVLPLCGHEEGCTIGTICIEWLKCFYPGNINREEMARIHRQIMEQLNAVKTLGGARQHLVPLATNENLYSRLADRYRSLLQRPTSVPNGKSVENRSMNLALIQDPSTVIIDLEEYEDNQIAQTMGKSMAMADNSGFQPETTMPPPVMTTTVEIGGIEVVMADDGGFQPETITSPMMITPPPVMMTVENNGIGVVMADNGGFQPGTTTPPMMTTPPPMMTTEENINGIEVTIADNGGFQPGTTTPPMMITPPPMMMMVENNGIEVVMAENGGFQLGTTTAPMMTTPPSVMTTVGNINGIEVTMADNGGFQPGTTTPPMMMTVENNGIEVAMADNGGFLPETTTPPMMTTPPPMMTTVENNGIEVGNDEEFLFSNIWADLEDNDLMSIIG